MVFGWSCLKHNAICSHTRQRTAFSLNCRLLTMKNKWKVNAAHREMRESDRVWIMWERFGKFVVLTTNRSKLSKSKSIFSWKICRTSMKEINFACCLLLSNFCYVGTSLHSLITRSIDRKMLRGINNHQQIVEKWKVFLSSSWVLNNAIILWLAKLSWDCRKVFFFGKILSSWLPSSSRQLKL